MFDEVFAQAKHVIAKHAVLLAEGQLRYDDFINGWRLTAKRVRSADDVDRGVRAPADDPLAERSALGRSSCASCSAS